MDSSSSGGFDHSSPHDSPLSSPLSSSSYSQKARELKGEVRGLQQEITKFYEDQNFGQMLVDRCLIPPEYHQEK